ncbi:MAG: hypothetical protein JJU03_00895 [Idiomarina sp.]|nr:hypothetical protein [Idiomarina sp.]
MKFPLILKSLGLLSCVSMIAVAQQTQLDRGAVTQQTKLDTSLFCAESYTISVNQSQVEKGSEVHAAAWIPVEIRRDIDDHLRCADEILISSGSDLNWRLDGGIHKLDIEPYDARRNRLQISPSGAGWIFKLAPGSAQDVLWLRVANASLAPPGSYYGYIELSEVIRDTQTSSPTIITSTQFAYHVEPSVSMHFEASWGASSGTFFNISLGDLTLGASKEFDMVLQSNTDVLVEVSSENNGYLTHEENSRYRIAYNLSIQHMPMNLSAPSSLPLSFEGNYENWRVPMLISVPAASTMMLAGSYLDTISVDVFPRH